jgi:hypothetical protein
VNFRRPSFGRGGYRSAPRRLILLSSPVSKIRSLELISKPRGWTNPLQTSDHSLVPTWPPKWHPRRLLPTGFDQLRIDDELPPRPKCHYRASNAAIVIARSFLSNERDLARPSRVAPAAAGGVGITHKRNKRGVYVEFYNNGEVCALFSDDASPPKADTVKPCPLHFQQLAKRIREFLDG